MNRINKVLIIGAAFMSVACSSKNSVSEWVSSTYTNPWKTQSVKEISEVQAERSIIINVANTRQSIEGFGACFNELGWASLSKLKQEERDSIFNELFGEQGANFTVNRMPMGANDFSLDWYSYDETDGDFELKDFSIAHDTATLIPFIKSAMKVNPNFRLWASPWGVPTWMKTNHHYACASSDRWVKMMKKPNSDKQKQEMPKPKNDNPLRFRMQPTVNGLDIDHQISEGENGFIQDERYLKCYGEYFGKFIDAYKELGINISMVMPQNEPNSAQPYPSCTWKSSALANFIGKYLGPEMKKRGVEVFYGTMERADAAQVDTALTDTEASKYIVGCGFQWAGKSALPIIRENYPGLKLYQTEQECGNGLNNWEGAMHSWDLMKHYFSNGVTTYDYWNISLLDGGVSRWGWSQNSLITVNNSTKTYKFTPEYYVMKHASHYVLPEARFIELSGTYDDALAFLNPDGSVVVICANQTEESYPVTIQNGKEMITVELEAKSINTILLNKK